MPVALFVHPRRHGDASLTRLAGEAGFETQVVRDPADAWSAIERLAPALVVLERGVEENGGSALLRRLARGYSGRVLAFGDESSPARRIEELEGELARARAAEGEGGGADGEERDDGDGGDCDPADAPRFGALIGASPAMLEVHRMLAKVAPMDCSVLISGETGTGKELAARGIHERSPRAAAPFVAVNCGAIQPTLIESELFGHVAGAFTGASRAHRGVFEQADGGTLLLDEITEMPLDLQVKLLRVLETRRVQRIGAERSSAIDLRVLAATNQSPEEAIAAGKLREDLYYRLSVFPIQLPPLRGREEDVALLARLFLARFCQECGERKTFRPAALERLASHDWPGNVRELRNVVERAFILAGDEIRPEQIRFDTGDDGTAPAHEELSIHVGQSIAEAERILIEATLAHVGGNKRKAAEVLGISVKTLYNRLNRYADGP